MIKVVLDANVLVSAILTAKGNAAKILDLIKEEKIMLVSSVSILEEIERVLLYPHIRKIHGFSQKEIEQEFKKIIRSAIMTPEQVKIEAIEDDPTDNKYLECAVEGEVDFIISGDNHLKSLKSFQQVKIVDPASFLEIIGYNRDVLNKEGN